MKGKNVIMKKLKVAFGLFLIFLIGSVVSSCSKDDDEPKSSEVSLIGTWNCLKIESTYPEDEEIDYPYFIVQESNCYFCKTSSINSWAEKYKYVYNEKNKTITVWQWYEDGPNDGYDIEPDEVWTIAKLTSTELWLELWDGDGLFKFEKVK